jgi:hypothetical protein
MTEEDKTVLEYVSTVRELMEMAAYVNDPIVDEAMDTVVKLSVKGDKLPAGAVAPLIVRLQAMAGQCAMKAKYYTVFEKGPESSKKKNVYYTLEEALDKIVQALKYTAKNGNY